MTLVDRFSRRLRYGRPIVVISGLPRSGTSLAMKMLGAGGLPLLTDGVRVPDDSNPDGYFEFEPVKALDKSGDLSWLRRARGRGVKVISWLVTWLPEQYDYQVIFMHRDLDEIIASQNAMLLGRGEPSRMDDITNLRQIYADHVEQVHRFLDLRRCFTTLPVNYRDVIERPSIEAERLAAFLHRPLDVERMTAAVDPRLYRKRGPEA